MTNDISTISKLAETVAAQFAEMESAFQAEYQAKAALLERVIEYARPALRALSSKLIATYGETNGQNGCNPVSIREYFDKRGVVLLDGYEETKDSSGHRGEFGGECLVLLSDGRLARLTRKGRWSYWQGEWDRYEVTLDIISAGEAVREFNLNDVIAELSKKLREQADGAATSRAKQARERAVRISALASLL